MISSLASPSVCVIDEDENDFRPILDALNSLYLSCVHIRGDDIDQLPKPGHPFKGLRLIFTDLHLSGSVGKDAASYTANVFKRVVFEETAPVVVVIWSKYAGDQVADSDVPPEDQETEAELFKRTLLGEVPKYNGRLIFVEMAKPRPSDRPEDWVASLKIQIKDTLQGQEAVHALWIWESLVREAGVSVSEGLTSMSQSAGTGMLGENLKVTMQLLAKAQSEGDLTADTAPRHLATVLAQLLVDQLEHANGLSELSQHGKWLGVQTDTATIDERAPKINGGLLTAATQDNSAPLLPGTIYRICKHEEFKQWFGVECFELMSELFKETKKNMGVSWEEWLKKAEPVLVEISPACDIDNGRRRSAIFMAGLMLPTAARPNAKEGDAFHIFPTFELRWALGDFVSQNSFLLFSSRYRLTLPSTITPACLKPWFRLRELPTASLRNWHAGHASRVGYVSL